MRLQKFEMFNLRMTDEIHFYGNLYSFVLCLDTVKLNACSGANWFDTLESAEEVEMPPGAAEFTVGCKLQSDVFLLPDDLLVSAAASISFRTRLARASLSGAARSRLPT
jgi:hypothetical protein